MNERSEAATAPAPWESRGKPCREEKGWLDLRKQVIQGLFVRYVADDLGKKGSQRAAGTEVSLLHCHPHHLCCVGESRSPWYLVLAQRCAAVGSQLVFAVMSLYIHISYFRVLL